MLHIGTIALVGFALAIIVLDNLTPVSTTLLTNLSPHSKYQQIHWFLYFWLAIHSIQSKLGVIISLEFGISLFRKFIITVWYGDLR